MTWTLALVDDHQLFREGLRAVLATQPDLSIVGEAGDARSAYSLVDSVRPDVVLLDISLPGISGIAATRELLRRHPTAKVLVLSAYAGEDYVSEALAAGATGYALKEQSGRELCDAIRAVGRGQTYLSPRVSQYVVEDHLRLHRGERPPVGPLAALTTREKEVFDLLVRGYSSNGIATQLCISVRTVETHRAHILKKLHLHSATELIRFAARHDLLHE